MREYLAEKLGRTVEIATATDLREFQRRTLEGAYDLVFTAANLALVAEEDGKLAVLGGFEPPIPALFVTRKDTPAPSPEALRDKALALANPQSLVAMSEKRIWRPQACAPMSITARSGRATKTVSPSFCRAARRRSPR
jgi:ABC-type phosphate/phosphonate transport system substrate-binding protein